MALRRRQFRDAIPAVAAEVLEARSLLSAGAAVAHHIQHAAAAEAARAAPATLQNIPVTAQVTYLGNALAQVAATSFAITPLANLNIGDIVKVQVKFSFDIGGGHDSVTGSISAKVLSWDTHIAGGATVTLVNAAGSFVNHGVNKMGHHFTEKFVPNGLPLTIDVDGQGQFLSLQGDYKLVTHKFVPGNDIIFLFYTS